MEKDMTLKIEIYGTPDHGPLAGQIDEAMAAIGFTRQIATVEGGFLTKRHVVGVDAGSGDMTAEATVRVDESGASHVESIKTPEAPKRERGKPVPGRARRTKEEIAEDEAADAADAAAPQNIQTGGERINPEDEATASQDAADEAAEDAANREPEKPLTLDDVKTAVGLYITKFGEGDFDKGRQIASEDGPGLFVDVLGAPPKDEPFWKFSILPTDQDKLAAMVKAWSDAAAAGARYKRKGA